MNKASIAYHVYSIYAVTGYDSITDEEYTRLLHSPPIRGTFEDLSLIADALTRNMSGVAGINYDDPTCAKCPNCIFDRWVPHHPTFRCRAGGEMDPWTQETVRCPHLQDGSSIAFMLDNGERYNPFEAKEARHEGKHYVR